MTDVERQELRDEFTVATGEYPRLPLICDSCMNTFSDEYVEWLEEYVQSLADRINSSKRWEDI